MKYDINCMQHATTIILTAVFPLSFIISFMQVKYINSDLLSSISWTTPGYPKWEK